MSSSSDELNSSKSILHGKYDVGRLLGRGTFAKVYHARDLRTNKSVAIKVVSKDKLVRAGMTEQIKREISAMKAVQSHPNVVGLYEVMATKSKIFLAMEYVRGGELFARISNGRLGETLARHYFKQLVTAVGFCHRRGVYHRDLKPENLLLDENGNLKVADFGLSAFSAHLGRDGLLHTTCGTPAYAAPEVVAGRGYDGAKADIWSCGVVLFALLAGYLPFQGDNTVDVYRKIYRGDFKCPPWFSSESRRLITRMLDPNPATRIDAEGIARSSWLSKPLPRSLSSPAAVGCEPAAAAEKETEALNAFHIISMSEGLNLSGLFDEGDRGMRFAAARDLMRGAISKLEELAKVRRSSGCTSEYNRFCSRELGPSSMAAQ